MKDVYVRKFHFPVQQILTLILDQFEYITLKEKESNVLK